MCCSTDGGETPPLLPRLRRPADRAKLHQKNRPRVPLLAAVGVAALKRAATLNGGGTPPFHVRFSGVYAAIGASY
jgi:hypothetical protein